MEVIRQPMALLWLWLWWLLPLSDGSCRIGRLLFQSYQGNAEGIHSAGVLSPLLLLLLGGGPGGGGAFPELVVET